MSDRKFAARKLMKDYGISMEEVKEPGEGRIFRAADPFFLHYLDKEADSFELCLVRGNPTVLSHYDE